MGKWLREFFKLSNEVNEDTVMGLIFTVATLVAGFVKVDLEIFFTFAGMTLAFFGKNMMKVK